MLSICCYCSHTSALFSLTLGCTTQESEEEQEKISLENRYDVKWCKPSTEGTELLEASKPSLRRYNGHVRLSAEDWAERGSFFKNISEHADGKLPTVCADLKLPKDPPHRGPPDASLAVLAQGRGVLPLGKYPQGFKKLDTTLVPRSPSHPSRRSRSSKRTPVPSTSAPLIRAACRMRSRTRALAARMPHCHLNPVSSVCPTASWPRRCWAFAAARVYGDRLCRAAKSR